ncbi:MAG: hypothetical protein ACR2NU_01805 [Aeoliella sp.]
MMALFHSAGSSQRGSGKFRSARRHGLQTDGRHTVGDYHFDLLSVHSTAGPIERKRFHVRIFNGRNHRVGYLRDFSSASQAIAAAKEWIEQR